MLKFHNPLSWHRVRPDDSLDDKYVIEPAALAVTPNPSEPVATDAIRYADLELSKHVAPNQTSYSSDTIDCHPSAKSNAENPWTARVCLGAHATYRDAQGAWVGEICGRDLQLEEWCAEISDDYLISIVGTVFAFC